MFKHWLQFCSFMFSFNGKKQSRAFRHSNMLLLKSFCDVILRDQIKYSLKLFLFLPSSSSFHDSFTDWFSCYVQVEFTVCFDLTDVCPKNASYYGNRAATLMMLSRYREALEDSQQAVRLDDTFMKVRGHQVDSNLLWTSTK